jgi:pantetheine-phosphate adenylyltransferase
MPDQPRPLRCGLYPGTFDPVTNGHLDVVQRAARLLDRLVVGVAANAGKGPMFSHAERVDLVRTEIEALDRDQALDGCEVVVRPFDGLLVDFAREIGARTFFRGLRAVADFDYEVQMFGMNSRLDPSIDTVFLVATGDNRFVASRLVKEIARLGGDISAFVPPHTLAATLARLAA